MMILKRFFAHSTAVRSSLTTRTITSPAATTVFSRSYSDFTSATSSSGSLYEFSEFKWGSSNVQSVRVNAQAIEIPRLMSEIDLLQKWGVQETSFEQQQEYDIRSCPKHLRAKLGSVFPSSPSSSSSTLNVVTVTYKTTNDMGVWNSAVKKERHQLAKDFKEEARQVAEVLQSFGFWVEFIDPNTGKAALNPFPGAQQLIETDDFYSEFGYSLLSKSCCRVLSHDTWGTHSFVGSLFTNAPSVVVDQCLTGRFSS
jgi:hypothetical protein